VSENREQFRVGGVRPQQSPTRNASRLTQLQHFDLPALGEVIFLLKARSLAPYG